LAIVIGRVATPAAAFGPGAAQLTCLATVVVAALSGLVAARAANQLSSSLRAMIR
jgi:hypothetical protein